jgi:proline iminopeptidase
MAGQADRRNVSGMNQIDRSPRRSAIRRPIRSYVQQIQAPPEVVLPLLCPVRGTGGSMRGLVAFLLVPLAFVVSAIVPMSARGCTTAEPVLPFSALVQGAQTIVIGHVVAYPPTPGGGVLLGVDRVIKGTGIGRELVVDRWTTPVVDVCAFPWGPPAPGQRALFVFSDLSVLNYPGTEYWAISADGRLLTDWRFSDVSNPKTLAALVSLIEARLPDTRSAAATTTAGTANSSASVAIVAFRRSRCRSDHVAAPRPPPVHGAQRLPVPARRVHGRPAGVRLMMNTQAQRQQELDARSAAVSDGGVIVTEPVTVRVQSPGAELAVRDFGGHGEPVVLLHGGPGVPDYLAPVAEMLEPRYRALTFDQRGVGSSVATQHRYELDDYLGDLEAVRQGLGLASIHLFGHSWGGLLAQAYFQRFPDRVRSLFLSSPSAGLGEQWKTTQREVFRFNRRQAGAVGFAAMGLWQALMFMPQPLGDAGARRLMRRVWRNYFRDGREALPASEEWLSGVRSEAMLATAKALGRVPAETLNGLARAPQIPILVLYGQNDIYETAHQVLRSRFPEAKHVFLEDSGHLPWLRDPARFRDVISDFYGITANRHKEPQDQQ